MKPPIATLLFVLLAVCGVTRLCADGPGLGNLTYASGELFTNIATFNSANNAPRGHGFVAMHKGYLVVLFSNDGGGGNGSGGFSFYDVSNPRSPSNTFTTFNTPPYSTSASSNYVGDIREAHGFSFFDKYVCLPSNKSGGSGVQFWDWSLMDPPNVAPTKIANINLPELTGGDYAPTPWWVFWQGGRYVYVAGTSAGIYILDASNPAAPVLVNRGGGLPNPIPTSQTGGFRINTIFAIGNTLVVSASDASGLSTFDISDPANPVLLDTITTDTGLYTIMVNGDKILGAHDPAQIWDISDPANITFVANGPNVADKGGYGTFQDGIFHYGSSSSYVKLDIRSQPFTVLGNIAPPGFSSPDWDFATVLGNLVFQGNDHSGSALIVHQRAPDTNGPLVNMVVPRHNATNQAVSSRVGLTFTDLVDLRSITTNTFSVRPVGGVALPGRYSHQTGIVNFWPDQPFEPNTTYEVVVPAGGIQDYVGNTASLTFTSRFTTITIAGTLTVAASAPGPATNGQNVNFTATAVGTGTPQFSWNFGDGSPFTAFSTSSNASHAFAQPGHYSVSVTATNGTAQGNATFTQTIYVPLTATPPTASGTIILDAPSNRVWCVNADSDTITAINGTNFSKQFESLVGKNPRTVAQAPDGTIWVVNQGDATINVLNRANGNPVQTLTLPRASRPYGIAFAPNGSAAYVSLEATGRLLKMDAASRAIVGDIAVNPSPRGLAVSGDSQRILVTRFISPDTGGEVTEVSAASFTVTRTFNLALDAGPDLEDSGRGLPNYLSSITISPDGRRAWLPSKKDNIQRGLVRDGLPLNFQSSVRTIVSQLDLVTNVEDLPARRDLNDRDLAFAARFSPLGDYVFVAVQGGNSVDVFDAYTGDRVTALEETGRAPQGLVLSPNGSRLFVNNFMSRTVKVYDTSSLVASLNDLAPALATIPAVANELLPPQVLLGKQIFYNAEDNRMNRDSYLSCASCHLDGGHDGRVWDFTDRGEGLRNTITLLGRSGMGQGRVHWTANFDEIQDFEHDIRGPFNGSGFMSDTNFNFGTRNQTLGDPKAGFSPELDALAAYVTSLTNVNPSPYRAANGALTADGVAGKVIFQSLNCAQCHAGNQFTDSSSDALHNVGTIKPTSGQRLGQPLTGFDTPTLQGVWETAPFFHDGSAVTLADVFAPTNGIHGSVTATLTAPERQQLVAYLQQIDGAEIVNQLPTVSLVAPTNGSSFGLPANIVLTTQTGDADGSVQRVDFYANGIWLGRVTNSPFSLIWSNAPLGTNILTARSTDNQGDFSSSSPVVISVHNGNGYSVKVNFQPPGAPVPPGYAADFGDPFGLRTNGLSYGWNATTPDTRYRTSDPLLDVRYATFNHLQKSANPNASWEIALPNGPYDVHLVAGDSDFFDGFFNTVVEGVTFLNGAPNNTNRWLAGSNSVVVSDGRLSLSNGPSASNNKICFIAITSPDSSNTPPVIVLIGPGSNATFTAAATIAIVAGASDSDGVVARVDYYSGAAWLGATVSEPHTFNWNTAPVGAHTLRAYATDSAGATTASATVPITVTTPPVSPFPIFPSTSDGQIGVSFPTVAGRTYTVEITETLSPANWQPFASVAGDGSMKTSFDTPTNAARFFRVKAH